VELPDPQGTIWGIDPSSVRVSLAILSGGPKLDVTTVVFSQAIKSRSVRFGDALERQVDRFEEWCNGGYLPDVVYLEEPYIPRDRENRGEPTHLFMYGVTLAALGKVCDDVPLVEVPPQTWKAKALGQGHGRAEKPEIMRWAQRLGYEGRSQDEADAIGVCVAGAVLRGLGSRVG
jgi:Holliday junction resolvasome RuvABC endonuclease subunit